MTEPQWQHIEVPRGAFISWGEQPGVQEVVGRLIDYAPTGGTDFQGNLCPQLTVELRAPTFSVNKAGERTDHAAGDLVVLNCGLVSLKRGVQVLAAQAKPGDLVKISFARTQQVTNGVVKEFDVSWAPGSPTMNGAGQQAPAQQQAPPPPQSWQQPQPQPPPPPQSWQQPQPQPQQPWQQPQPQPQQPWQQPQQQPVYAQAAPQAPQAPVPPGGAWGSQQAEPPF